MRHLDAMCYNGKFLHGAHTS